MNTFIALKEIISFHVSTLKTFKIILRVWSSGLKSCDTEDCDGNMAVSALRGREFAASVLFFKFDYNL